MGICADLEGLLIAMAWGAVQVSGPGEEGGFMNGLAGQAFGVLEASKQNSSSQLEKFKHEAYKHRNYRQRGPDLALLA